MAHHFFNLHDDRDMPDPDGMELPDFAAARRAAVARVGSLLAEADEGGLSSTDWRLDITDERGLVPAWIHVETANLPFLDERQAGWRAAGLASPPR